METRSDLVSLEVGAVRRRVWVVVEAMGGEFFRGRMESWNGGYVWLDVLAFKEKGTSIS